ncbi:aldo/keto reductase [Leucobacter insecticola]|uniref:Aldo/keto reductase n=1 Tax=Leucobacter insecticola TaxID=2714934 RepID=A0A6G8FKD6_9MICO|nr:aldo/keto reductase [Leucobacter insecticola]QIM16821.1 aldo/keto reductase [Leucobacter insecticola]
MERNTLGHSGLQVPPLTLGSYHVYDRMSQEEIVDLLRTAVDAGINWFDVGHYASAANPERRVSDTDIRFGWARIAAGIKREDYIHTEKLWFGGPRPTFKAQLAESLPRAQVDAADIVIENPDTAYHFGTPHDMKDIVTQMAGVIDAGLSRFWGINHATPAEIREACEFADREGMPLPTVLQLPYSAIARRMAEDPDLVEVMTDFDLTIQASNTLAVGVLVGRPAAQAGRPLGPDGMTAHAERVAGEFAQIAESLEATPAQLAIAFTLANPHVASVIAGMSKRSQLEDNLGAISLLSRVGAAGIRDALSALPQNERELSVGELEN